MTTVATDDAESNESIDTESMADRDGIAVSGGSAMRTSDRRVTARVVLDAHGETHTEYTVGGVAYSSLSAIQRATGGVDSR